MKWIKITIDHLPRRDGKACLIYNHHENSKEYCVYSRIDREYKVCRDNEFVYMNNEDIVLTYSHYTKLPSRPRNII